MINLANQLTRREDPTGDLEDQLLSLEISVKSAEAEFENAKLTREVAEIAVIEYDEGIFLQHKQTLEGERKRAQSDAGRKRDRFALAKNLLAENKPPSQSSPSAAAIAEKRQTKLEPLTRNGGSPMTGFGAKSRICRINSKISSNTPKPTDPRRSSMR